MKERSKRTPKSEALPLGVAPTHEIPDASIREWREKLTRARELLLDHSVDEALLRVRWEVGEVLEALPKK